MYFMPVKPFDITHCTESSFFRFPQPKSVDFIFVGSYPLTRLPIFIQPENENTDNRDIENHSVCFGQYLRNEGFEIRNVVRHTQPQDEDGYKHQNDGRGKQWLFNDGIEKLTRLLKSFL